VQFFLAAIGKEKIVSIHRAEGRDVNSLSGQAGVD
jgi:hypothetical protein